MSEQIPKEDWPSIPNFNLLSQLNPGGYGVVFLAEGTSQARKKKAIKVCWPSPLSGNERHAIERFKSEAAKLAQLNHPQIASFDDFGISTDSGKRAYIVMEYIDGETLRERAKDLSPDELCALIIKVLVPIQYCHNQKVIHRDLTPRNIVVRAEDGMPVLVDFGLSIDLEGLERRITTGDSPGTPGYIPPAVISDAKHLDVRNDIFQLGVVLYDLLSGQTPDAQRPTSLPTLNSSVTADLDIIVQKALKPENQRYGKVEELRSDLQKYLDSKSAAHKTKSTDSQHLERFRERLLKKKGQVAQRKAKQESDQDFIRNLWVDIMHPMVTEVAKHFQDFVTNMGHEIPGLRFPLGSDVFTKQPEEFMEKVFGSKKTGELLSLDLNKDGGKLSLAYNHEKTLPMVPRGPAHYSPAGGKRLSGAYSPKTLGLLKHVVRPHLFLFVSSKFRSPTPAALISIWMEVDSKDREKFSQAKTFYRNLSGFPIDGAPYDERPVHLKTASGLADPLWGAISDVFGLRFPG